jgi:hypothetical protein
MYLKHLEHMEHMEHMTNDLGASLPHVKMQNWKDAEMLRFRDADAEEAVLGACNT